MKELIDSLQQLGLTSYESKVLIALTQYGSGTAADIHALSGIPRSAVYGVINRLDDRGVIETQNTKPMRYKALAPNVIINKLKADYEEAIEYSLEQLKTIYNAREVEKEEDSVWNISGVKNVNDKIIHMLESAENEIIFASSYPSLYEVTKIYPIMDNIKETVRKKIGQGVNIKLTGRDKSNVKEIVGELPGVQVRTYSNDSKSNPLKGGILVIDNREILVITIKEDVVPINLNATWYNGKEHVQIFKHFIDTEWEASSPIDI
ncbi:MAG: helix-turn-helix domain-containing protein [Methanolobus sp.]|nr:helix-turn-helix domain-containing protein [Methanolobus sp.]